MLRFELTRRVFLAAPALAAQKTGLLEVRKIWDEAPHNAFTDLIRSRGRWFCTFREGQGHVSPDGALRVLESNDGVTWRSAALIRSSTADLRDPKLSIAPGGKLMLNGGATLHQPASARRQSMAWFSDDGRTWSDAAPIGDPDFWLWRVTWHNGVAYTVGYSSVEPRFTRLYHSRDGRRFETLVDRLFDQGSPNESSLLFHEDGSAMCLMRREREGANSAMLGRAKPPYREWEWQDLGIRVGGPQIKRVEGRLLAATRLYGPTRTSLSWIDPQKGGMTEFLKLPSSGDSSYAGLVMHEGLLWVSYYSSHEGKTSIYLARVKL
jgi:hypothetical protein